MKNALLVGLTILTITLSAVCWVQLRRGAARENEIARLRAEAEQLARDIADLEAAQKFAAQQRAELLAQASTLAARVQSQQLAAAPSPASIAAPATNGPAVGNKNPFGDFFAKMMEDPDTKKLIRDQQRLVLDQLYSPLVSQLGLSPAEAEQFKDLLADNMLKSTERATSLFGDGSSTNRTELMAKLADEQKAFEETVRSFLGENRYAQYQDYQQTVGERTQLNQFRQQFAGENALSDQQTEQLLAFMREEKQAVNATGGFGSTGVSQDAANLEAMMSGAGVDKIFQNQETINQRVLERARAVLSESQLNAFGKFQANQLQMMRAGLNMARRFMSPGGAPGNNPP